jgi:NAD(P)-dependent dehydrogenase (short-subunit alcohol dehydrogenase family)
VHVSAANTFYRTKSLAVEWARAGIRINCVAPGVVFNESAGDHYEKATGDASLLQKAAPYTPAKRNGTVEEISSTVLFLLSPGASFISGISIDVGGGSHLTPNPFMFTQKLEYPPWPKYEGKL